MNILQLNPSDTGTTTTLLPCKKGSRHPNNTKTILQVLEPPSQPMCYDTEVTGHFGNKIIFK